MYVLSSFFFYQYCVNTISNTPKLQQFHILKDSAQKDSSNKLKTNIFQNIRDRIKNRERISSQLLVEPLMTHTIAETIK